VIIAGAVARRIEGGGHVWALLQWALGFQRLGWSVLFLDRIEPSPGLRDSSRIRGFVEVMDDLGLEDCYSLDLGPHEPPVGLSRQEVLLEANHADLLVNIMGYLEDEDVLARVGRRVFLDIDPGFGQMWKALGWCDPFDGHDAFVTVGGNLGKGDCRIPTCELPWIPTLPPVVMDLWPRRERRSERFTSVGAWRGPFDAVEFRGYTYGLRVHEFRRFASVPRHAHRPFQMALDLDPADASDRLLLERGGWELVDPSRVAGDPWAYRRYIQESMAEFQVSKGMYVQSRSGWFSDRTACYLATGRPALVQDTELGSHIETGEGLLTFRTPQEAVEATKEIDRDWIRHSAAARELAVERLESGVVLNRLLERLAA
jgi:hypothetical protein